MTRRLFMRILMFVALGALFGGIQPGYAAEEDPVSGLLMAPGWELVRAHCGGCHSYRLVTSQRGDAAYWLETIRWMQRTQNLWPIEASQENQIVAYLAGHYDETEWGRRPPLGAGLSPGAR